MNEDIKDLGLYGWLFTYNPYQGKWVSYHNSTEYFNGESLNDNWTVFSDEDINKLIETVKKHVNGDTN